MGKKSKRRITGVLCMMVLLLAVCIAAAAETETAETPKNGIPLMVIRIDESEEGIGKAARNDPKHAYGTIEEMECSELHSIRCIGDVEFIVPEGYTGEYGSAEVPAGRVALKYIRGRGNMSWVLSSRKPYKIKFEDDLALFGMGAGDEWTLMSNRMESTRIRNRITYWLGEQTGLGWAPKQIPVDVVMIGSKSGRRELGSYTLCQTVQVEKNRLDIPKLKKDVTSENPEDRKNITGGYLLSLYSKTQDGEQPESTLFTTGSGLEWRIRSPEFEDGELTEGQRKQSAYIRSFVQETEDLILKAAEDGAIDAEEHQAIAERMDMESAADYWWIQVFSMNTDAFGTSSTYLYKTPDTASGAGKLYWGPLWDFDMGWEGKEGFGTETEAKTGFNNGIMIWFDELRAKDPLFTELLKERWQDPENGISAKLAEMTAEGGIIDRYRDEIRASWTADYLAEYGEGADAAEAEETFNGVIESLRSMIDLRREWADGHLDELDKVYFRVTYTAGDETVAEDTVRGYTNILNPPEAPEREGFLFAGWKEKESGESIVGFRIMEDTDFTAGYLDLREITAPEAALFEKTEYWENLGNEVFLNNITVLPENAETGTARWTSSNPEVAAVDGKTIHLAGTGETTITVTLWNGVTASCRLHVYDPKETAPEGPQGVAFAEDSMTMRVGETNQIPVFLLPGDRPVEAPGYRYTFTLADPSLAEVSTGVAVPSLITGTAPGTTVLTVTAANYWDEEDPVFTAECEITVTEE